MKNKRILIIGSTGFVGQNLMEVLSREFPRTTATSRKPAENCILVDLESPQTWENVVGFEPDVVINAAGYGVVKHQQDGDKMKQINYYQPYLLKSYLDQHLTGYTWLQIGTAFEYDLKISKLDEGSPALPLTDYGISKQLFTAWLQAGKLKNYVVLRPFAMFGPGEDASKLIPALILAQKSGNPIPLSSGMQERDYFFVRDLAEFIVTLLTNGIEKHEGEIYNLGTGVPRSLRSLAEQLAKSIPSFNPALWQWEQLNQRGNEGAAFYNHSGKARDAGFKETPLKTAFDTTIEYYYQIEL